MLIFSYTLLDFGEYSQILSNAFLTHFSKDAFFPWTEQWVRVFYYLLPFIYYYFVFFVDAYSDFLDAEELQSSPGCEDAQSLAEP
jgi:hypothetical protein